MNLQENISRIKEVMGLERKDLNESFFSELGDKLEYWLNKDIDLTNKYHQRDAKQTFEKMIDLLYKISIKESPVDELDGVRVVNVDKQQWGGSYMDDKDKGKMWEFIVRVDPYYKQEEIKDEYKFRTQFDKFYETFQNNADRMGLTRVAPFEDKDVQDYRVKFRILKPTMLRYLPTRNQ